MNVAELRHRFQYHPPRTQGAVTAHELIRSMHLRLAEELDELLPDGREKALAVTQLEQSMFWANAAVARQVKGLDD